MPGSERLIFSPIIYRILTRPDGELLLANYLVIRTAALSSYKLARRVVIATLGSTVLAIGFFMLFLPGPGIVVIPVGLAILSIEFAWARFWLRRVRERISGRTAENHGERAERHRDRFR